MYDINTGFDLSTARETLGLNRNDFAMALGISKQTLGRHEKNTRLDILIALAVECLLRRSRGEPEERAEARFREAKRLHELKVQAGMVRARDPSPRTGLKNPHFPQKTY